VTRFRFLLGCLGAALLSAGSAQAYRSDASILESLPAADVIILGETHDNPLHHRHQARAVAALAPSALVFEMLTPDQASRITPDNRADAAELARVLEWEGSGWPDFDDYFPIFAAAPDAAIFGGGVPIADVRRSMTEGPADVFGAEAARYGLDDPLPDDQQAAREELQSRAHCDALPEAMLPGMVGAQRLRDASLARAVVQARAATGGSVVLITGSGHARTDWGVPAKLARAAPELSVLSVGQLEAPPEGTPPFDLWIVTDPAPRDDPCDAFR